MAKIPIILEPGRADGKLATSSAIFDENKHMFQSEINDIQDTLNSDNPNKPLSAKQGKVLKELLDTKVIESGGVPIDIEPTEGNITNVVSSNGIYKALEKKVNNVTFEERNKNQDEKLAELEIVNHIIKGDVIVENEVLTGKIISNDGTLQSVPGFSLKKYTINKISSFIIYNLHEQKNVLISTYALYKGDTLVINGGVANEKSALLALTNFLEADTLYVCERDHYINQIKVQAIECSLDLINLKENIQNKTSILDATNTDIQYPSAKAVYTALVNKANNTTVIEVQNDLAELHDIINDRSTEDLYNSDYFSRVLDNIYEPSKGEISSDSTHPTTPLIDISDTFLIEVGANFKNEYNYYGISCFDKNKNWICNLSKDVIATSQSNLLQIATFSKSNDADNMLPINTQYITATRHRDTNGYVKLLKVTPGIKSQVDATNIVVKGLEDKVEGLEDKVDFIKENNVIYDIINYGIYSTIYNNYTYNEQGILIEGVGKAATNLLILDKEHDIFVGVKTETPATVLFFNKNKEFILSKTANLVTPIRSLEFPTNAYYIAFTYGLSDLSSDEFYTTRLYDSNFNTKYHSHILKLKGSRPIINIFKTDSSTIILEKLIEAWMTQDCDVVFECGEYLFDFQTIYSYMRSNGIGTYRGTYEMPIGGNCRYYFNNSIIKGLPSTDMIDTKVFGNMRCGGCNFELFDGTVIAEAGIVYTIHDEGQGSAQSYTHKYHNMKLIHNGDSNHCIGLGLGLRTELIIDNCVFECNTINIAGHGVNGTHEPVQAKLFINNSYFSHGISISSLAVEDTGEVIYCGNSHSKIPSLGSVWKLKAYCNELRN